MFGGIQLHSGTDRTKAIAEVAGGIFALAIAVGILTGRLGGRDVGETSDSSGRMRRLLERPPTFRVAALAGPATHVPGLFYLLALDLIVASQYGILPGLLDLAIYNVAWFALPLGALAACIVSPNHARAVVEAIQQWTSTHARRILLVLSFGAGVALLAAGLLAL